MSQKRRGTKLDVGRFREDLRSLAARACAGDNEDVRSGVFEGADTLVGLF